MNKPDIFIEGLADPVQARGTDDQISDIVHALKNCMSVLHFWVEVNRGFPASNEESIEDLRNLTDKMTSLIERLADAASSL
jgi:hypothetical protein